MKALKSWVKTTLLRRGILVSRPPGRFNAQEYKLQQIKARGLRFRSAVDAGAADGMWARSFKAVYPAARLLCVEPRADTQAALQEFAAGWPDVEIAQALLASGRTAVGFHLHGDQSSMLANSQGQPFGRWVTLETRPLDELVKERALEWPDYLKLDLQGAELEALEGGRGCLEHAEAVQLELSFLHFQRGQPLAADVFAFMAQHGFCCYDIFSLWPRPLDGALAQGDFLFLRANNPLRQDCRWSKQSAFS